MLRKPSNTLLRHASSTRTRCTGAADTDLCCARRLAATAAGNQIPAGAVPGLLDIQAPL